MSTSMSDAQPRFFFEADMLSPLTVAARNLMGQHSHVVYEVPAAVGVPDVVIAAVDFEALLARGHCGFLTSSTDLAVVLRLARGHHAINPVGVSSVALAADVGISHRHLRSSILPLLEERSFIAPDGDLWYLNSSYKSIAKKLVAIEVKLRDWKKGLSQAARQVAGSDQSWLVIDKFRQRSAARSLDLFDLYGVGLATLDQEGALAVLRSPQGLSRVPGEYALRRELLAERVGSLIFQGESSGPIPSVFGNFQLATTGADPRVQGAEGY